MALTPQQMDEKLDEHFTFEQNDDIDGVLGTLADNVEHDIVGWPAGIAHGREGAKAFYDVLFKDIAGENISKVKRLYGHNFMVDESLWEGTAPGNPFGMPGRGRPLNFRILHVMEFTDAGEISREQVWLDFASIMQQLQGE